MQDGQAGHRRPGHQVHPGLGNDAKGALGAYNHLGQVNGFFAEEGVQVVAADAPHNLGVAGLDFRQVVLGDTQDSTINIRFQAVALQPRFQFMGLQGPELGLGGVGEDHIYFLDMVQGLAIDDRVGATGVVANAAAHAGPIGRGGVGGILEAVSRQVTVQRVENNARLHLDPAFFAVKLHHLVHVFAEVHDDAVVDGLTGKTGTTAAGQHGYAIVPGDFHDGQDVFGIAGNDHAHGFHLVDAGIGAVEDPGEGVETHLAGHSFAQLFGQFGPL